MKVSAGCRSMWCCRAFRQVVLLPTPSQPRFTLSPLSFTIAFISSAWASVGQYVRRGGQALDPHQRVVDEGVLMHVPTALGATPTELIRVAPPTCWSRPSIDRTLLALRLSTALPDPQKGEGVAEREARRRRRWGGGLACPACPGPSPLPPSIIIGGRTEGQTLFCGCGHGALPGTWPAPWCCTVRCWLGMGCAGACHPATTQHSSPAVAYTHLFPPQFADRRRFLSLQAELETGVVRSRRHRPW